MFGGGEGQLLHLLFFILLLLHFIIVVVVCYIYTGGSQRVFWELRREVSNQNRGIRENFSGKVKNMTFEE